jgi:hypothetical protein
MGVNGSGMGVLGVIGRTSSLTCSAFSGVTLSRKMRPSSALPQVLLRACQIARHAASCRRRELRLSLASRDSSLKLSKDAPRARTNFSSCPSTFWHLMSATVSTARGPARG